MLRGELRLAVQVQMSNQCVSIYRGSASPIWRFYSAIICFSFLFHLFVWSNVLGNTQILISDERSAWEGAERWCLPCSSQVDQDPNSCQGSPICFGFFFFVLCRHLGPFFFAETQKIQPRTQQSIANRNPNSYYGLSSQESPSAIKCLLFWEPRLHGSRILQHRHFIRHSHTEWVLEV